ncbi:PDDEXK nuclease domain-containing protein [Flavobacterium marginilacus]|uniref:PDDEXK nuclease domain-containing protein n=1 Tax=Flavobacterium marginilacus TaxID=3003256 RepID=UPI00248EFB1A|nr:PDDEXK nuclease domain-containing protein [Flavobacterium marginilacus]
MDKENSLQRFDSLYNELSFLIEQSQYQVVIQTNSVLTLLFWQIGFKINNEILNNNRADYGKQIVPTVSAQLENKYGRNFTEKNVRRMLRFAEQFPDKQIVVTFSRKLNWSHFIELLPIKNPEAKLFYADQVSQQLLSVRDLRKLISTKTYERTTIANIQASPSTNQLQNTFKDPYLLDFLNLGNAYLEKDLEQVILNDLEKFILELGKGFTFVERQKRMIIDDEDFYLDLLFYHRKLRRLVAVELKLGKFQAKHKGQMELYLKWLDKHEKQEEENPPIGLILCAESSKEQVELLEMHKDGIIVAEYWTDLPPKKQFEEKIHLLLLEAKKRLDIKN